MELKTEDLELSFFNNGSEFYPCYAGVCLTHKPTGLSVRASSCWSATGNESDARKKLSKLVQENLDSCRELRNEDCELTLFDIGTVRFPLVVGVRVKHIPSGLVAECSTSRSAHSNAWGARLALQQLVANHNRQEKVMPYNKDTGDAVLKTANEQIALLRAALEDLAMCMQGVIDEEYKPDSFTLQAARKALAETEKP